MYTLNMKTYIKNIEASDLEYSIVRTQYCDTESWHHKGVLHSINDEPAVVVNDGEELTWYKHGMRHREQCDGPAFVAGTKGTFKWYNMGVLHRTDGPALVTLLGWEYYNYGKLHRTDGPARDMQSSWRNAHTHTHTHEPEWFYNGKKHDFVTWAEISKCESELFVLLKLEYG